jgi:hypothetical protein
MSATVQKTNVLLTLDYTWKFKGKSSEDNATSVLRYKDDYQDWITRCPLYDSEHPDLPGFVLTEIEADREPGDQIAVTLTYEIQSFSAEYPGKPGSEAPTPRYSMTINEGEEHILTSSFASTLDEENRKALLNIANGNEEKADGSKWEDDVIQPDATVLLEKIRKGFISRISDTVVYTERKLAEDLDDLDYSNVNKRQLPPGPVMGTADNWLYIGGSADPSEAGDAWTITKNWKYSPDGWDEDIYPEAA